MQLDLLGSLVKNGSILSDDRSIGIYALGMKGNFHHHRFFVHGKETNVCSSCFYRIKHVLNECSVEGFCYGFRPLVSIEAPSLDLDTLTIFLNKAGYLCKQNYQDGFIFYPFLPKEKIISVHLFNDC